MAQLRHVFKTLFLLLLAGAVGAIVVVVYYHVTGKVRNDSYCQKTFGLTSQSLDCGTFDDNAARIHAVDATLDAAIPEYIKEGRAQRISVFIRDLETKQYSGTNELDMFAPASLLKLPLAIAYYKYSEIEPTVLAASTTYTTPPNLNDQLNYYTHPSALMAGQSYTTEQLIDAMLQKSDNGAYYTLAGHLDNSFYNKVMLDLGIQIPTPMGTGATDYMTAKSYGNIFRMLYNSSYLSRADSQHILSLMTSSDFKGLTAPLPASVVVAHKFGERSVFDQNGTLIKRELHDCGIVYKSPDPYSICIMTEGPEFDQLNSVINDISKIVYDSI